MKRQASRPALRGLGAAAQDHAPKGPRGGLIAWRADLAGALLDARAAHRPLMLYFTHDR